MDNKPRPAPLSADSLPNRYVLSQEQLDSLLTQARQRERQRIADSLPKLPYTAKQLKHHYINEALDWNGYTNELAKLEILAAVRAVLESPEGSRLTSKGEQA